MSSQHATSSEVVELRDSNRFFGLWTAATGAAAIGSLTVLGWGVPVAALFGAYSVWGLWRLLSSRPRIRVTTEGIVDDNFWFSPGLIPWEDIVEVRPAKWGLIDLDLRDEQAFWDRLSPLQQIARIKTQFYGLGPAVLTPWCLSPSRSDVLEALQAGLDEYAIAALLEPKSVEPGRGAS